MHSYIEYDAFPTHSQATIQGEAEWGWVLSHTPRIYKYEYMSVYLWGGGDGQIWALSHTPHIQIHIYLQLNIGCLCVSGRGWSLIRGKKLLMIEWGISDIWMRHVTYLNESCPIFESYIWIMSRHIYEWVVHVHVRVSGGQQGLHALSHSTHTHTHAYTYTQVDLCRGGGGRGGEGGGGKVFFPKFKNPSAHIMK